MKRLLVAFVFSLCLSVFVVGAQDDDTMSMPLDLEISNVWAAPTVVTDDEQPTPVPGQEITSAVYMIITNNDERDARLISAETDVAALVQLHQTFGQGENATTQELSGGVFLTAGETTRLEPDGRHVVLLGPDELEPGDVLSLTLTFEALEDDGSLTNDLTEMTVGAVVQPAAPSPENDFVIDAATVWARPADAGGTTAIYMNVQNPTDLEDTLIAGETDVARIVEIHETALDENDVMTMRPLQTGLTVPPGEMAVLEPGGLHVMLLDLPEPLSVGDTIPLTLVFDSGAEITIAAPVEDRMMGGIMNMDEMDGEG